MVLFPLKTVFPHTRYQIFPRYQILFFKISNFVFQISVRNCFPKWYIIDIIFPDNRFSFSKYQIFNFVFQIWYIVFPDIINCYPRYQILFLKILIINIMVPNKMTLLHVKHISCCFEIKGFHNWRKSTIYHRCKIFCKLRKGASKTSARIRAAA